MNSDAIIEMYECFKDLVDKHWSMAREYSSEAMGDEGQSGPEWFGDFENMDGREYCGQEFFDHCNEVVRQIEEQFKTEIAKKEKVRNERLAIEARRALERDIKGDANSCCGNCIYWNKSSGMCELCSDLKKRDCKDICYSWKAK